MINNEESKKIKALKERIKSLTEENKALKVEIGNLECELQDNHDLIAAAENYREEHQQMMLAVAEAREKYEIAYKKMQKIKKDYETRMGELIKALEE